LLIVRWLVEGPEGEPQVAAMSLILENGDVHRFYSLGGDIHHSYSHDLRGRYQQAVNRELSRRGAQIVYEWGATPA
jgi:hypothetical protein